MEDIIIKHTFNKAHYIEKCNLYRELNWRKNKKTIIIFFTLTIAMLAFGLGFNNDFNETNPFYSIAKYLAIVTAILFLIRNTAGNQYSKRVEVKANEYEQKKLDNVLQFTEEKIKYSDDEKVFELKWIIVSHIEYKEHLFMTAGTPYGIPFILSKKEIGETTYLKIIELLKSKNIKN